MTDVTVMNQLTGAVGKVPARLYNSSAFNKDDVWVLYDGDLDPDCNCNGQDTSEESEIEIPLSGEPGTENDLYDYPESEDA